MSTVTEQIAEGTEVRTAVDIPVAALERFYERMYPARAQFLKQHWRWLYRVGSFPAIPAPLVALRDGEVVGHAGLIPVTLRRRGEERTAIWFVDFGVLREHQRKGIGILLTREWMAACPLQITFCNERSIGVFLKYGWDARFHTLNFKLLLRPDRHPKLAAAAGGRKIIARLAGVATRVAWRARSLAHRKISVAPAAAAPSSSLASAFDTDRGATLHVPRTSEFLRWRTAEHPCAAEYIVLSSPGEKGSAEYSMMARVVTEDGAYRRLHLLALRGDAHNQRALAGFFAGIVRWALAEDIHHIWFITSDPAAAAAARWWFPVRNRARFACHANDSAGEEFLSGTDHLWECLDSDFELGTYEN